MAAASATTSSVLSSFAVGPSTLSASASVQTRPTVPVKIFFETTHAREIRRTRIATDATWEEAIQLFGGLFPDSYVVVSYVDADGDTVTVETPFEWKEALRQHTQAFGLQHTLRITLDATQPASHIQPYHHVQHSAPPQFAPYLTSSFDQPMYSPQPHLWANLHSSPDVVSLDSHEQSFATNSPHHLGEEEEDEEDDQVEEPEDQESDESVRTLPAESRAEGEEMSGGPVVDSSSFLSSGSSTGAAQNQRGLRAFLPASLSAMVDETVGEFVKQTSSSISSTLRGAFANMREVAEHVFEVPMLESQDQYPQRQTPIVPSLPVPAAAEQVIEEQGEEEAATENDTYSSEFEDEEPEPELPEALEVEEVPAQMPPPPYAPSTPVLTPEDVLLHMGFTDVTLVRQVLPDNNYDVSQALDALLAAAAETPRP